MKAILEEGTSIYLQISQSIEDDILNGIIVEEDPIPSTNQFAKFYGINPATAAKGVGMLADEGIVYKKRGIGMYVATGAKEIIRAKRKRAFYENFIDVLVRAKALGVTKAELIKLVEEGEHNANA